MSTQSERIKRYRARQRHGIAMLTLPVPDYDLAETLIKARRLSVVDALDRKKVAAATAEVVLEWVSRWRDA